LQSAPTERPPVFLSLRGGMQTLVDALAQRVGDAVETDVTATGIVREPTGGYRLTFADRPDVLAETVVLTVPATVAAGLLAEVAPNAADRLRELWAVHAGTISLAYRTADIPRPLPGYGLVIPKREGRAINAVTVASRKFGGRAPVGWELLRLFFGGYRSPATMELDDVALLELVRDELRDLLGIAVPPAFHRIYRWPAGSPQYDVGHLARIAAIEAALPPRIALTGSPYRGVGIPDVINEAQRRAGAEARRDVGTRGNASVPSTRRH
jgi:protoporphyrinogen/coproporphyrinogen III oxidase